MKNFYKHFVQQHKKTYDEARQVAEKNEMSNKGKINKIVNIGSSSPATVETSDDNTIQDSVPSRKRRNPSKDPKTTKPKIIIIDDQIIRPARPANLEPSVGDQTYKALSQISCILVDAHTLILSLEKPEGSQ